MPARILTLLFPVVGHAEMAPANPTILDWALSALSLASGVFFFLNAEAISNHTTLLDELTWPQIFFGTAVLLLTLEATRRTTGAGLTGIVVLLLIYNWFGFLLPPAVGLGISDFSYLLDIFVFTNIGVFGVPNQVVASFALDGPRAGCSAGHPCVEPAGPSIGRPALTSKVPRPPLPHAPSQHRPPTLILPSKNASIW